jgi:hypothetical protein
MNGDTVKKTSCSTSGAYQVLLKVKGTLSENACANTDYTEYLQSDDLLNNAEDFVPCIKPVS